MESNKKNAQQHRDISVGVYKSRLIVKILGSPAAMRLALEKLILPDIDHLA
jgi:molybdopterin biosynthesis enzyme MoaB